MRKYESVTQKNQAELDGKWIEKLGAINERIFKTQNRQEYLEVIDSYLEKINGEENWNNLSLCLRRYIYEQFTGKSAKKSHEPYSVDLRGKRYYFGPVLDFQMPDEQELEDYADLLYQLTLENECYAISRKNRMNFDVESVHSLIDCGRPDQKRGAISKKTYSNYLNNHSITRKGLFTMSMALKFDVEAMETFAKALGESPVYNFRNADECIYCFCHSQDTFQRMQVVREIKQTYEEHTAGRTKQSAGEAGETEMIRKGVHHLAAGEYPDEEAAKREFLAYLLEQHDRFIGYSKKAQKVFLKELRTDEVQLFRYGILPGEAVSAFRPMRHSLQEDSRGRITKREMGYKEVGSELYSVLIDGIDLDEEEENFGTERGKIQIKDLEMDKRVTENLLSGERLSDLLSNHARISISKKDFLTLRFDKLAHTIDFAALNDKDHLEVLKEFQASTNAILQSVGLPDIYVGNPFDHLILTALCDQDPLQFVPRIFDAASHAAVK